MHNIIESLKDATLSRRHLIHRVYDILADYVGEDWDSRTGEVLVRVDDLRAAMRALELGHDKLKSPDLNITAAARLRGEFYRSDWKYYVRLEIPELFKQEFDLDIVMDDPTWGLYLFYIITEMRKHPYFWKMNPDVIPVLEWVKGVIDKHFSLKDVVPDFIVRGGRVEFNIETEGDPGD